MKRVLLGMMLFVGACNGRHLAWVENKKDAVIVKDELRESANGVELTFDDGPSLAYTPRVLDILKKYKIRGTFFVEGINLVGDEQQAVERRSLLKRIIDEGHIVGNHSYDHKLFTKLSDQAIHWQIDTTNKLIEDIIGKKPELIRLPYGAANSRINKIVKSKEMKIVGWQIDPREWERDSKTHQFKTAPQVVDGIMAQFKSLRDEQGLNKLILILHDTKKITIEVLPTIIEKLREHEKKETY